MPFFPDREAAAERGCGWQETAEREQKKEGRGVIVGWKGKDKRSPRAGPHARDRSLVQRPVTGQRERRMIGKESSSRAPHTTSSLHSFFQERNMTNSYAEDYIKCASPPRIAIVSVKL